MSNRKVAVISIGSILTLFSAIGILLLSTFINKLVIQNVMLINGTETFKQFMAPTIPILMEVYVFHLENPAEVLNGGKPVVRERGPYTYREHRQKYDLHWNNENGSILYHQNKTFFFDRSLSIGSDSEHFVTANIPLLTLMNGLRFHGSLFHEFLSLLLDAFPKETLFIERSIRNITWGYNDPVLQFGMKVLPKIVNTDFIGVLTGINDTYDGVYEILDGTKNISNLGQILKFNASSHLTFWSTQYANLINGSDGSIFPPFLTQEMRLRIFLSDICRSVYVLYDREVPARVDSRVKLWRFSGPDEIFENATLNPDNLGFCTPDSSHCLATGLLNLTVCKSIDGFQLPIIASQPHFLAADPAVVHAIDGMAPNPEQHRTYTHLEPTTGIVMEVFKRLQINVKIGKIDGFEQLGKVRNMYYPVLWVNESAIIDEANLSILKKMFFIPRMIAYVGLYSLLGLGVSLAFMGVVWLLATLQMHPSAFSILVNDEDESLA